MFSKTPWKGNAPSYAPIHDSSDLFVHLICPAERDSEDVSISMKDLLSDNYRHEAMSIFHATGHGVFALWTSRCRTTTTTTNTCDEAFITCQEFIRNTRSRQRQICALYNSTPDKYEKELSPEQGSTTLAVLARYDENLLNSLGLPPEQQKELAQLCRVEINRGRRSDLLYSTRFIIPCICSVIACLLLLFIVFASSRNSTSIHQDKYHSWIKYDTRGSIGPRYQLDVTGHNASEWESYTQDNKREWVLRVDDQALIPLEFMDEEERHWQDWFQKRYPEVTEIAMNRNYVNETWLNSPDVDLVPVDDLFHFTHCIIALKRYWKAKKTGKHVCGRDIDEDHVGHCIASFDWWAFPEGRRGTSRPNVDLPLWWRTKVCFD